MVAGHPEAIDGIGNNVRSFEDLAQIGDALQAAAGRVVGVLDRIAYDVFEEPRPTYSRLKRVMSSEPHTFPADVARKSAEEMPRWHTAAEGYVGTIVRDPLAWVAGEPYPDVDWGAIIRAEYMSRESAEAFDYKLATDWNDTFRKGIVRRARQIKSAAQRYKEQ